MTGRVAILKRGDREIRMLCPDQDAAFQWIRENFQRDDEFVCIKNWDWRLGEVGLRDLHGEKNETASADSDATI